MYSMTFLVSLNLGDLTAFCKLYIVQHNHYVLDDLRGGLLYNERLDLDISIALHTTSDNRWAVKLRGLRACLVPSRCSCK